MPDEPEFREIIAEASASGLAGRFIRAGSAVRTSGEIRPTDVVPVIAPDRKGARGAFPMRWGFVWPGRQPLANARSETAGEKPAFRESWERRRCVIPASWYYEWEHLTDSSGRRKTGAKYMIQPKGSPAAWLCGLYRTRDGLPEFTVLTREPPDDLRRIHDRMPLMLPAGKIDEWISPDGDPEDLLRFAVTETYFEKADGVR